jgi:hypothetical protein
MNLRNVIGVTGTLRTGSCHFRPSLGRHWNRQENHTVVQRQIQVPLALD